MLNAGEEYCSVTAGTEANCSHETNGEKLELPAGLPDFIQFLARIKTNLTCKLLQNFF
jgi:hypothetical protein